MESNDDDDNDNDMTLHNLDNDLNEAESGRAEAINALLHEATCKFEVLKESLYALNWALVGQGAEHPLREIFLRDYAAHMHNEYCVETVDPREMMYNQAHRVSYFTDLLKDVLKNDPQDIRLGVRTFWYSYEVHMKDIGVALNDIMGVFENQLQQKHLQGLVIEVDEFYQQLYSNITPEFRRARITDPDLRVMHWNKGLHGDGEHHRLLHNIVRGHTAPVYMDDDDFIYEKSSPRALGETEYHADPAWTLDATVRTLFETMHEAAGEVLVFLRTRGGELESVMRRRISQAS